jgi:DNA-binding response OmpR family regulator
MRILLIEDDRPLAHLLSLQLVSAGYVVDRVGLLSEADAAVLIHDYALILLDRRLPDGDGLTAVKALRQARPGVPIIMLTALDTVRDKVSGLDAGADDYLTKPVDGDELLARIRAALRRPGGETSPPIQCGRVIFEPGSRQVSIAGAPVAMKRRELALFECLILRARRVVQRETLMNRIYGFDDDVQSNALDAHVSRLRTRLSELNAAVTIHPIRGVGYLLDEVSGS